MTANPAAIAPAAWAKEESKQRPDRRQREAGQPSDPAQPARVLAGDAEPHFLQQVVFLGMRRLEQAHLAAPAERGGAGDGARAELVSMKRQ